MTWQLTELALPGSPNLAKILRRDQSEVLGGAKPSLPLWWPPGRSQGGSGVLSPAHLLVGCCHMGVDEGLHLGPGSVCLRGEVVGVFLCNDLQHDSSEFLRGGRQQARG